MNNGIAVAVGRGIPVALHIIHGAKSGAFVVETLQLATRLLSCAESMSCSDAPFVTEGHGKADS